MLDQKLALANQKASNFVINNENLVPTIKKINEQLKGSTGQTELFSAFRMNDVNSTGVVAKDDFINVVFDYVKQIKPADLMNFVTAYAESEGESGVKYEDFLHLINRNGEIDGLENQLRQMSIHKK